MKGYQLTFFTQQNRMHDGRPLAEWLIAEARRLGVSGATLIAASEGFGHHRKIHSAHFIELADQPLEVTMAVSAAEADEFMLRLRDEGIRVFFIRTVIEFGMSDE